jgi:hypothetical protein
MLLASRKRCVYKGLSTHVASKKAYELHQITHEITQACSVSPLPPIFPRPLIIQIQGGELLDAQPRLRIVHLVAGVVPRALEAGQDKPFAVHPNDVRVN